MTTYAWNPILGCIAGNRCGYCHWCKRERNPWGINYCERS